MHQQLSMYEANRQEDHLPTYTNLHDHKLSLTIEKTSLPRTNAYTLPTLSYARKRQEKKNHRHHVHRHKVESAKVKANTENVACNNNQSSINIGCENNNHNFNKVSASSPSKSKSNSQETSMNKSHPSLIMTKMLTPLKTPEVRYVASLETLINWEKSLRSSYNYALTPVRHHLSKLETSTSTSMASPHAKAEEQQQHHHHSGNHSELSTSAIQTTATTNGDANRAYLTDKKAIHFMHSHFLEQQQQQLNNEEHIGVDNNYNHHELTTHVPNKFSKMLNRSEKKVNNTN